MYVPKRGDFVWLQFNPQSGHEQKGKRPTLVLSRDRFNQKMGFVYVCPISTTKRKNPFYVPIPEGGAVTGVVMVDQMRSLDYQARKSQYIGRCSELLLQDVLRRIKPILFE